MKERLITLAGALFALYLVINLFIPPQPDFSKTLSFPTTDDKDKHGLWGFKTWLDKTDMRVISLRNRLNTIWADNSISQRGNILIISLPSRFAIRERELEFIDEWITAGNSLIIFSAFHDWPEWTSYHLESQYKLLQQLDIDYSTFSEKEDEEDRGSDFTKETVSQILEPDREISFHPVSNLPYVAGLDSVTLEQNVFLGFDHIIDVNRHSLLLPLLKHDETNTISLWYKTHDAGNIFLFTHADIINNGRLSLPGNLQLMQNIIANTLTERGSVIFDDFHQGLSNLYDPDAFFSDPRLHNTLFFILILWIIYIIGHGNRFGPINKHKEPINNLAFVKSFAGFIARQCDKKTVAEQLLAHFNNEVRRHRFLPTNGEPVWDILSHLPNIDKPLLHDLKSQYDHIDNKKNIDLNQIFNQLQQIRKML